VYISIQFPYFLDHNSKLVITIGKYSRITFFFVLVHLRHVTHGADRVLRIGVYCPEELGPLPKHYLIITPGILSTIGGKLKVFQMKDNKKI